jgi:hypothetical protein
MFTLKGDPDTTWSQLCYLIRDIKTLAEYTQFDNGFAFEIIENVLRRTIMAESLPIIGIQWRKIGSSYINHT